MRSLHVNPTIITNLQFIVQHVCFSGFPYETVREAKLFGLSLPQSRVSESGRVSKCAWMFGLQPHLKCHLVQTFDVLFIMSWSVYLALLQLKNMKGDIKKEPGWTPDACRPFICRNNKGLLTDAEGGTLWRSEVTVALFRADSNLLKQEVMKILNRESSALCCLWEKPRIWKTSVAAGRRRTWIIQEALA